MYACFICSFQTRCLFSGAAALQWRHNESGDVSNHRWHECLLNCLFRHRSKKTSKLRFTGLCAGKSPVIGEFPTQRASNSENVSIWWRHHGLGTHVLEKWQLAIIVASVWTSWVRSLHWTWPFLSFMWVNALSCPGVGVTKPFFSVPLFSTFSVIVKTSVSYWISRSYLAGVTAAQLRGHLSNMNVIQCI